MGYETAEKHLNDDRYLFKAEDLYRNTAGEQEARDVVKRLDYSEKQRQAEAPDKGNERTVFVEDFVFSADNAPKTLKNINSKNDKKFSLKVPVGIRQRISRQTAKADNIKNRAVSDFTRQVRDIFGIGSSVSADIKTAVQDMATEVLDNGYVSPAVLQAKGAKLSG